MLLLGAPALLAQSYFDDDIYYNPDKDKAVEVKKTAKKNAKKQSNYIANMADMDVDDYNRRNQYYMTPIDTIGRGVENGEDFVYTQQIQKYYNPTIVVDNADVLEDVLANSYGNVDIEINASGVPVFVPTYSYAYGWPYYSRWGINIGPWGWGVSYYDPWYWNIGPAWAWGPSWSWGWGYGPAWAWGPSWGWGPSWSWGPSWGWGHGWGGHPSRPWADWRPNGNRPFGPGHGLANSRPGSGRTPIGGGVHRPSTRPGVSTSTRPGMNSRPSGVRPGNGGVVNNNGRWEYNGRGQRGTYNSGTSVGNRVNNRGGNIVGGNLNNRGNRTGVTNSGTSRPSTNKGNVNRGSRSTTKSTGSSYNSNRSYNRSSGGSYNSGRSYGGGGSRGTVGGGGSRGGGGGRGRR